MRKGEYKQQPSPCSGCPEAPRCAAEKLACRQYNHYLNHGSIKMAVKRERVPSRARWRAIFGADAGRAA